MRYSEVLGEKMKGISRDGFVNVPDVIMEEILINAKEYEEKLKMKKMPLSTEVENEINKQRATHPKRTNFVMIGGELLKWLDMFKAYDAILD